MKEPTPPRVLTLTGAPHPQALVQSVDAAAGVCVFAWLNAEGERVDSGGSVARFIVSWEPGELPDERVYIEPTDAELADAIANPPVEVPPVPEVIRSAALRYVLNAQGLRSAVEAAVYASDQNAQDAWKFETNIRRDHPLVTGLSGALGLTSAQVDDIFRAAALL